MSTDLWKVTWWRSSLHIEICQGLRSDFLMCEIYMHLEILFPNMDTSNLISVGHVII